MTSSTGDHSPEVPLPVEDIDDDFDKREPVAPFPIVGVGASAGGLEAFTQLLKALPADAGMAFVLVQHLAPTHASALAEILGRVTRMPVMEVHDEPTVEPNHVYVIPPDRNMIIVGGALRLLPREGRGAHHPVDQFFRALAKEQRHRAIGVVLSGTATDGTVGLEEIKAEGGITFAQDATAQHEGMPHSAIASGCVDFILPPVDIAKEIIRIGTSGAWRVASGETRESGGDLATRHSSLATLLQVLHHAMGVDFTGYKFNTLYRRVTRRMVFQKIDGLAEYVAFLRQTPGEVEALYQDILISVTSFFRDKESFEALKSMVFPRLLKDRSRHDPVRLWTLGCSTGQEAYSLAISFAEAAEAAGSSVPLQLFASDLNTAGIETARAGVYAKDIALDVSPERLRRFFVEVDGHYRIGKAIRDACVFSRHNVLEDPPFSRIDVISCRNLLIYLEPALQQRIMPMLHYALKPAGCLWLGGAETIGTYRTLFEALDAKHKIYARKPGPPSGHGHFPLQLGGAPRAPFTPITARPEGGADLHREADRVLSAKFAPPGVLVSADLDILHYRGDTSPYLAPAPGKASLSLLKMLREGLLVAVRAAVLRAGKEGRPVREEGLRVKSNGGFREVAIEIIPLTSGEWRVASGEKKSGAWRVASGEKKCDGFLILFEEKRLATHHSSLATTGLATPDDLATHHSPLATTELATSEARLEQELAATREYLQSVIEQQEAANEELQSANEEVQSANEELQSTNEELETSKEEIQSSNEELATVNDELNNRNAELNRVNNDLVNLLGSVQMAIVMVGPDLRVRRFTPMAEKVLNLIPTDVGRPLGDIKLNLENLPDLGPLLAEVIDTVSTKELDIQDKNGRWYSMRLRPYKTLENKIDGVVVMLVDVDAMKRAHAYTESIVSTVREPLVVLDGDLRVRTASRSFYETYQVAAEETIGRFLYDLGNGQWNIPELRRLLEEILPRGAEVQDFKVEHDFEHIGKKTMLLNATRLLQLETHTPLILLGIADITEHKQAQEALRQSDERFRNLADNISQLAWTCDQLGNVTWYNQRWLDYTGLTFEEMQGWGWKAVQHPDHVDRVVARVQRSANTGEPWEDTFPLRGKDGHYRWFLSRAVPIRDLEGKLICWFGTNTDITEQRHMADELRQNAADMSEADRKKNEFLAILAHELRNPLAPIRNALQILRLTERDEESVQSASAMMDRQVGQMVRLVDDLLDVSRISRGKIELRRRRVELASVLHLAVEAARALCKTMNQELTLTLPPNPVYLNADPTRLAQVVGNLLNNACKFTDAGGRIEIVVSVEWRVASEEERVSSGEYRMASEEKKREFSDDRAALSRAQGVASGDELGTAMLPGDEELSQGRSVRHDQPDSSSGGIDTSKHCRRTGTTTHQGIPESSEHRAGIAHGSGDALASQPTSGFAQSDDAERASDDVGRNQPDALRASAGTGGQSGEWREEGGEGREESGEWRVTSGEKEDTRGDLLATRHSPRATPFAVIRVRDTGIGIAAEQLHRIFDMFTQVDTSLERSVTGLGIGLTLVKNLVEMHGGSVEAHSAGIGQGSEFVVRLPLASDEWRVASNEPEVPSSLATRHSPHATRKRILVVDDNRDSVSSLAMLLELTGNKTHTAADGLEAVTAAEKFRPEVILMDIGLPKLNGYEAARRIREQPWGKAMMLVALTGWGQEEDKQKSKDAGFNGHLVKPVDLAALAKLLAESRLPKST